MTCLLLPLLSRSFASLELTTCTTLYTANMMETSGTIFTKRFPSHCFITPMEMLFTTHLIHCWSVLLVNWKSRLPVLTTVFHMITVCLKCGWKVSFWSQIYIHQSPIPYLMPNLNCLLNSGTLGIVPELAPKIMLNEEVSSLAFTSM